MNIVMIDASTLPPNSGASDKLAMTSWIHFAILGGIPQVAFATFPGYLFCKYQAIQYLTPEANMIHTYICIYQNIYILCRPVSRQNLNYTSKASRSLMFAYLVQLMFASWFI